MKILSSVFRNGFAALLLSLGAQQVSAQACDNAFPLQSGTSWTLNHYDGKGKLASISENTILNITSLGEITKAEMQVVTLNAKGKEQNRSVTGLRCEDGVFHLDFKSLLGNNPAMNDANMQIKLEGEDMMYPKVFTAGVTLPDAHVNMEVSMNGMVLTRGENYVTNRKVVGQESITTPAGTFNAWKITADFHVKTMGIDRKGSQTEWLVPGKGIVRLETHDEAGALTSYYEMVKFQQ